MPRLNGLIWVTRPIAVVFCAVALVSLYGRARDITFVGVLNEAVIGYRIVSGFMKTTLEAVFDITLNIAIYDGLIFWLILASMNLSAVYLYFSRKYAFAMEIHEGGDTTRLSRARLIFLQRNALFILANFVFAIVLAPLYILFAVYKIRSGLRHEMKEQARADYINARSNTGRSGNRTIIGQLMNRNGRWHVRVLRHDWVRYVAMYVMNFAVAALMLVWNAYQLQGTT